MKRRVLFTFSGVIFLICSFHEVVRAQQVFKTTEASVIAYLEYLPKDYNLNSDKYPVVIFLHGIGERGANTTDRSVLSQSVQTVAKWGPPKYAKAGTQFPFILISPQLKNNYGTWPSAYVMEVINYVKTYLRIDEKRIYLTGLSLGGGGAWWTAQDHPEVFAALAPVCGGYNTPSKACDLSAENLPVWAFHGDADPIVSYWKSVNMVNAINDCTPVPSPKAKMTIYAGVGHDAWKNAYRIDHTLHNPNVYEWMLSFKNVVNGGNKIPTANAGSDKVLSGASAIMTGSASDPDGVISTYLWTQLSGPAGATLNNKTTPSLHASNLRPGEYVFSFRVTDNGGASDTDYVKIKIENSNQLPVVHAGSDQSIYLPADSAKLTGSADDADGAISSFLWTKISGPSAILTGANTSTLRASDLTSGTYLFRLTVTDDQGGKSYDDVSLFVMEAVRPVANAGSDITIFLPANSAKVTGTATDASGPISAFSWSKISGPSAILSNAGTATLTASELLPGTYVFRLTVTNAHGATGYDDINIFVKEPVVPVVDAGSDKLVMLPSDTVTISGTATDSDGSIVAYRWVQTSGAVCVMTHATVPSLSVSGLRAGLYTFRLIASDDAGLTDYDDVSVQVSLAPDVNGGPGSTAQLPPRTPKDVDELLPPDSWSNNTKAILGKLTSRDLETCLVKIFNGSGKCLYAGPWTLEKYKKIFSETGLYIYQIIKRGRRIDAGKIYIRH